MKLFLSITIFLLNLTASGHDKSEVDLRTRWELSNDPTIDSSLRVVSLRLKASDQGQIVMRNQAAFSVFINRQLIVNQTNQLQWNLDSLKNKYVFPITLTIYSKTGIKNLQTFLLVDSESLERKPSGFKNAVTIVSIVLSWLFIFLMFSNRASFFEYLNIKNLLAIRVNEEASFAQRITSLSNIFVYTFCALLSALVIIVLNQTKESGTVDVLVSLLQIFLGIFVFLLLKILVTNFFSRMFGLGEYGPGQFFFFVSFLLITFGTVAIILLFQFILDFEISTWNGALGVFVFIMCFLYLAISFLRYTAKGGLTVFHLFSYLCSSEIFPAILLLKIFYL